MASYLLAKKFGWTPRQLLDLTMAQLTLYVDMIREDACDPTP